MKVYDGRPCMAPLEIDINGQLEGIRCQLHRYSHCKYLTECRVARHSQYLCALVPVCRMPRKLGSVEAGLRDESFRQMTQETLQAL